MKRAALYARYSSDLQSAKSCEDQLAMLRAEAGKRGWVVVREYRDEAITGTSMVGRHGLEAMMLASTQGAFDIVLIEALDRLARDLADTETLRKLLAFRGIDIVTPSIEKVTIMHSALGGLMSTMFVEQLAQKTKRGLAGRIDAGRSAGGRTYGYKPVKGEPGELVVDEAEAAIVLRILREYADGDTPLGIVARLNKEGVPGPRGRGWSESTINGEARLGYGVLHNELYVGMRVWNRQSKRKDPVTGRARMFDNPESEWKRTPAPGLRIVEEDLWSRVRTRHRGASAKRGGAKRPARLFSGLLACGCCGGGMSIVGPNSYGCSNHAQKRTCENRRSISERQVMTRTIEGLKRALLDPAAVREAARQFHAALADAQRQDSQRRATVAKTLADIDSRISRLVDAIAEGGERGALLVRLRQLEEEREQEARVAKAIETDRPVRLHPNAGKLYADAVGRLGELLADPAHPALKTALRALVGRIVLTPRELGPGYEMEVRGDLAPLLAGLSGQNAKTPAVSSGGLAFPVKGEVGAGTGFEPVTFRL